MSSARRAITLLAFLLVRHFLGWLLVGLTIWVATFFRDPIRTTPRGDKLIVAPADGLITMIAKVPPPPELRGAEGLADGEYTRVSIFMSVFDVHINRAPIAGRVQAHRLCARQVRQRRPRQGERGQ